MVLTRDPIGERTTYWTRDRSGAIRSAPRLRDLRPTRPVLNLPALRDYLSCAFVPGDRTLFDGVFELRPGVTWDTDTTPEPVATEALAEGAWPPEAPLSDHAARLRPLLEAAVARRLPQDPDEPLGVYLSGGLDSSLVAALVRQMHTGPVHTFSIHFGAGYPNELPFSQAVADHLGTIHHVVELSERTIQANLEESIAALDDPIGDPLTTPNLMLGKAAAAQGLRRIFNGEGGDPVFGGPKNLPMVLHALYDSDREDVRRAYFRSYQKCYDDLERLLTPETLRELGAFAPQEDLLTPFLEETNNPMRSYLNRLMRINVRLKGADQILTKVNNLTTHCGLTAASPLFDTQIVEAGFAIPPAYKLDGTREKAVLKEAVKDLLPEAVVERPKSGMMVPVQRWFRGPMGRYARARLLDRRARTAAILRRDTVRDWLDYKPMPFPRHGVKIWLLLTLEIWMRENGF